MKMSGNFKEQFGHDIELIDREIGAFTPNVEAPLFYDPIRYMLNLKGKRIRPLLVLLCAEACAGKKENALAAAAAVELLHNFTLVHDDIMDQDDFRRGQLTVHKKWDISTAILAGDGLMGLAFQKLLESPVGDRAVMTARMVQTMIIICEGQALDKSFENQKLVSVEQYMDMIARKTAVLLELSCELGGLAAETDDKTIENLKKFGYHLGLGFQIQDDLLDIIAAENNLGKKIGSDLKMHKQTLLTIRLREKLRQPDFYDKDLETFKKLLHDTGVQGEIETEYKSQFRLAFAALECLPVTSQRDRLYSLAKMIENRTW